MGAFYLRTIMWSSDSLIRSEVAMGTKFHDWACFSTRSNLDRGSASKKFTTGDWLYWETLGGNDLFFGPRAS